MVPELSEYHLIITGASRGVGKLLAEYYLEKGSSVSGFSRGPSSIDHEGYSHFSLDVSDDKAVSSAINEIGKTPERLVLINCAALKCDSLSVLTTLDNAEKMFKTNVLGAFSVSRHAAMMMKKKKFGRVVNLTSVAAPLESVGTIIYGASKRGLEHLNSVFSKEFAKDDITFNSVGISTFTGTEMYEGIGKKELDSLRSQLTKADAVNINELVHIINCLISPEAGKITNQVIYFGGVK